MLSAFVLKVQTYRTIIDETNIHHRLKDTVFHSFWTMQAHDLVEEEIV